MQKSDCIIGVEHVSKFFGDKAVLNDVNLSVRKGEFVTILGPSGCGKTTLLRLIAGFQTASEGVITIAGKDITQTPPHKRPVNTVFQKYALFPHLNVFNNIAFGLKLKKLPGATIEKKVKQALRMVGMTDYEDRDVDSLSGGQQQRVAIARAIVNEPEVLLLDEPLSNLDARLRMEMRSEIRRIQQESKVTTIFVTHDQEEAMSITDEIVLMRQGVVQQVAGAHEMYMDPANSFVASFMGNPPISYVDVQVGGGSAVLENGLRLPCRSDYAGHAKMGIRPEAWALGGDLSVTLTDVEMRGQDQVVSFTLAGQPVRAILNAEEYVRPGQEVHLRLSEKRCYLFNPETGVRL